MYQFPSSVSLDFIVLPSVSLSLEPSRMFQYLYIAALLSVDALSLIYLHLQHGHRWWRNILYMHGILGSPGGVQDLAYLWMTARQKTVSSRAAVPRVPTLDTRQAGYGQITPWASAILDASHYCLLLTLTRLRVNRIRPMKILALFIREKVILDSLTEAQACLGSWFCRC